MITFPCQRSAFLLQQAAVADHTLSLSAVALSMHTCQPWASAERWGRGLGTLIRTTQDGCFPSCSSISRPMIHFTDTWVIIGVCSSPLGMKLHERSQGGERGWVVVDRGSKTEWEASEWKQRDRNDEGEDGVGDEVKFIKLVSMVLFRKSHIFSDLTMKQTDHCCVSLVNHWQLMWQSKQSNENIQHMTF